MSRGIVLALAVFAAATALDAQSGKPEAVSLAGKPLFPPASISNREKLDSYHRRLLMYKGLEKPDALLDTATADATTIATQGYGVGNYYFVMGDTARAAKSRAKTEADHGHNAS